MTNIRWSGKRQNELIDLAWISYEKMQFVSMLQYLFFFIYCDLLMISIPATN